MTLHFERIFKYMNYFLEGLQMTCELTGICLLLCIGLTAVTLVCRFSRNKVLKAISAFYISFFRGVPCVVQLFVVYFGTAALTGNVLAPSAFTASIITFTMNSSAYYAENLRGGILGVDKGQLEAAKALGVGKVKRTIFILLPQAIRSVAPALVNTTITLLKNTSIVSQIGVLDLMRGGQVVMNITYLSFEPLIVVAFFYLILILIITYMGKYLEKRLNRAWA